MIMNFAHVYLIRVVRILSFQRLEDSRWFHGPQTLSESQTYVILFILGADLVGLRACLFA
jgi:hypothetical protein